MAALAAAALALSGPAPAQNIRLIRTTAARVPVKVIVIDLNDPTIKITAQMARNGAGHAEPFNQMIRRARPTVAVTGTFFSLRSHIPVGDIVIDGQLAHFGGLGTALCVTDNNEVEFVKPARYRHQDWSAYDFVICCGPRLITNGKPVVLPRAEGFRDRHMLSPNSRLAIGVTRHNKLMIVATREPVILSKLARAMRALGAVNAINLDAGSSLALYYKGKTLIKPARWLTNLILIYNDKWAYQDRRDGIPAASRVRAKQNSGALWTTGGAETQITLSLPPMYGKSAP
jgi:hypothetical protein